jgi:hypothetical protein
MHALDRQILEYCSESFRPLSELRKQTAQGTFYRHVKLLCNLGFLEKQSSFYRITEGGRRALVTASTNRTFNSFADVYTPIAEVPTPTHRAMCELIFGAAVARRHKVRADRHPYFAAAGQTLRWKSSTGQFCCYGLGLDPAQHLVECGSESGKSLAIRRDHSGAIIFKRELLDAPFVVLDEFLCAEPSVRPSLQLFLTGRLQVPFENTCLIIQPVPLLTLNIRDRPTLEEQFGLSAPQIRRGLIANFDAVPMPDLAMMGDRAVLAAQQSPPLRLDPPTVDCAAHQRVIVQTLRRILAPDAQSRVDVEVVITLCTGMTAFIPDAEAAIVQVLYNVGMMAESMKWTNLNWIEAVLQCSLSESRSRWTNTAASPGFVQGELGAQPVEPPRPPGTIPLHVPQVRREPTPSLSTSDALKNRLIWAAVDTGQSLEGFLNTLLDFYLLHRKDPNTITILNRTVRLADDLQLAEVDVAALQGYVATEATLRRAGLWMDDVPEALQLLPLLEGLPQSWTWKQAQNAMRAVAYTLRHGIDANHLNEFLAFHHALARCGINEKYLVELVTALEEAGVLHGSRKKKTLDRLIARAARQVDVEDLIQQAQELGAEIKRLEARRKEVSKKVEEEEVRIATLGEEEEAHRERVNTLADEIAGYEQERAVLHAARLILDHRMAAQPTSVPEAHQSSHAEPDEQTRQEHPAVPQYGQWLDQMLHVLQQCGGLSSAGPEKEKI